MFSVTTSGSFKNTTSFLTKAMNANIMDVLNRLGKRGVEALSIATPVRSGLTASSWGYRVTRKGTVYTISWYNTDNHNGYPVAVMIQYGHATGTGGFVQGYDYINPAMRPVFDQINQEVWRAVTSA